MKTAWLVLAVALVWVAAGGVALALVAGDKAPETALPSTSGTAVSVGGAGGWRVVYFYPKSFTPGCNNQACGLRDSYAAFQELGVTIYGVSTDKIDRQKEFKAEYKLPFELLADENGELAKAFGVDGMLGMAKRITFIINPEGVVTDVVDKFRIETHDEDVLALLKTRIGAP